jgi:hypothetical protein
MLLIGSNWQDEREDFLCNLCNFDLKRGKEFANSLNYDRNENIYLHF